MRWTSSTLTFHTLPQPTPTIHTTYTHSLPHTHTHTHTHEHTHPQITKHAITDYVKHNRVPDITSLLTHSRQGSKLQWRESTFSLRGLGIYAISESKVRPAEKDCVSTLGIATLEAVGSCIPSSLHLDPFLVREPSHSHWHGGCAGQRIIPQTQWEGFAILPWCISAELSHSGVANYGGVITFLLFWSCNDIVKRCRTHSYQEYAPLVL